MNIQFSKMERLQEPLIIDTQVDIDALVQSRRDIQKAKPLDIHLEAQYLPGRTIKVTGTMKTEMVMACSRCLNDTTYYLDMEFNEQFTQNAKEADDEDNEDDLLFNESDSIDLRPYIEENVLLQLPFIPLCSDDCKGLCPVCGTNQNEQQCGCSKEKVDPRLAGLADLKNKMFE